MAIFHSFFYFLLSKHLKLKYSWFTVMLISTVQHSDSVIIYIHIHIIFNILFHYGLFQDNKYSSMCYKVGPCCPTIHSFFSYHWVILIIGLPRWLNGKDSACRCKRSLGKGRSPGGGHGNPLQYSCLENPTDKGAWPATATILRISYCWRHSQKSLGQSLVGSLPLSPGSWGTRFCLSPPESASPVLCKFGRLYGGVNGDLLQEGLCHTQVHSTQSPWPCGRPLLTRTSQEMLKHSSGSVSVGSLGPDTRPPDLPLEKSVCRSGSNS